MEQTHPDAQASQHPATNDMLEEEAFFQALDLEVPVFSDELGNRPQLDTFIDHYLEALAERERTIAENRRVADARKAMIEQWLQSENTRIEREAFWLTRQIEAFAAEYDYGKKKSRNLPHGTFGVRRSPDRLEVNDEAAALEYAATHGIAGAIKRSILKTPLLKHLKETGDIPDGCELLEGTDTFYVKPTTEG